MIQKFTFNCYLKWFSNKQPSSGDRCVARALGSISLEDLESRQPLAVGPTPSDCVSVTLPVDRIG